MKKRILSLIVVLSMLIGCLPVIASASMNISIGQYVQMGAYYGEPILWRCVDIDENGPLMLSDKILCIKAFDAESSNNITTGSHSRNRSDESNYWGDSNMRSWLNSTASAGNVNWLCGNPPIKEKLWNGYNAYDKEAGFLSNFTQSERNAMKEVRQKSLLSYPEIDAGMAATGTEQHGFYSAINEVVANYDIAYAEYVTDKMFCMDVKQVNEVYNNSNILGEDYYIGEPTAQCVKNSEYKTSSLAAGKKWYYWLRSPDSDNDYSVCGVNSDGKVGSYTAHNIYSGVRPAFYLNLSSGVKSGYGTASNPYTVVGGGSGTVTPPPVVTLAPTPTLTPDKGFEVNKYRADFLLKDTLGSTMENTYFNFNNTPSNILYQAVKDSNVLWQTNAWKAFSDTVDSIDSPSNILDYAVEEKDFYTAIIFNMFESATDFKIVDMIDTQMAQDTRKSISTVSSAAKNLYNYDFLTNHDIANMTSSERDVLQKCMKNFYQEEHGDIATISKVNSYAGKFMEYANDFEEYCELYANCYSLMSLSDAMKAVLQEMYNKCPLDNMALRTALKECVAVLNANDTTFPLMMSAAFCSVAGKDTAQFMIDKMWDSMKSDLYAACPQAYVIMTAYKAGKLTSNVIFNVDDITEKLFKLEAMVNSENVLDSAYKSVKSKYKSDKTEEKAEVYNSAIDVMFNALDTDCDYALAYVNSVDSSTAGKINAALGDTNCAEMKKSIDSIQDSYTLEHASVLTAWIYELENDYPELYPQYEPLVDETYSKYVKKYEINCPVDVYIYDTSGKLEGSVINNVPYCSNDKNITISINNDAKTVYFYDDREYNIVYEGNDTGTMDIAITEYDENQNEARNVYFNDLILEKGTTYSSSDNANVKNYVVSDETNTAINSDYDTNNSGNTYTVSLERGYFEDFDVSAELHEGENAQIRAYVPYGYKFDGWTSDAGEGIFENANSVSTRIKMPAHNVNITANIVECPRLVLSDITSNSVTVTARACEDINSGTVILAIYDNNDILKNVVTKDFKQEIIFDNLNLNDCTVKAMLWDNINTMKPLAYMAKQ